MTKQQLHILRNKITVVLENHLKKDEALERANNIAQFFSIPVNDLSKREIVNEISLFLEPSSVKIGILENNREKVAQEIYQQFLRR